MKHPIKIAITGKIGSGKTFVSKFLKELGYKVFESDEEVAKIFGDLKFKKKIECLFSKKISKLFMKNGLVNRKALGDYVFSRKIELEKLENIIYPILKKKKKEFISLFMEEKILFFDIPLLFQKKLHREFNYIILLWLERKLQLKRVLKRKGMSQREI